LKFFNNRREAALWLFSSRFGLLLAVAAMAVMAVV
jgi:hypothetical protein